MLGASYKAGIGDIRESPALKIIRLLRERGGEVSYHDPYVSELIELGLVLGGVGRGFGDADLAAIVTAHPELDYEELVAETPVMIDFRGVTRKSSRRT